MGLPCQGSIGKNESGSVEKDPPDGLIIHKEVFNDNMFDILYTNI